jgi:RNA polymerase sigma-70 factor (ECF subfamily)
MASEPGGGGGDSGPFKEIAALHRPYLYQKALHLSGDRDVADDLVQETLTRAWSRYNTFTQGTDARAWMVTILTRLYFDMRKHDGVILRARPQLMVLLQVEPEVSRISDAKLQAALDSLGLDDRKILELFYFRHMKYREITEVLQLPLGTIGSRLRHARKALCAALNLPWDDQDDDEA